MPIDGWDDDSSEGTHSTPLEASLAANAVAGRRAQRAGQDDAPSLHHLAAATAQQLSTCPDVRPRLGCGGFRQ